MSMMLFAIALQASTVTTATAEIQSVAPTEVIKPKLICENIEIVGSRLSTKRVCMSKDQWMQRRRDDQDRLQQRQVGVHTETAG